MSDEVKVGIILFCQNDSSISEINQWVPLQNVSCDFMLMSIVDIDYSNINFPVKIYHPISENEKITHQLCRMIEESSAEYITWIDSMDCFCQGALYKMYRSFQNNEEIKIVCGDFYISDEYGEKRFSPMPYIGKERITQKIETSFLIEKNFLLQALKDCYADQLWKQFIWNSAYEIGEGIKYIPEKFLKKWKKTNAIEIEKNLQDLIEYFARKNCVDDLRYLLKIIEEKCGTKFLCERLMGIISPKLRTEIEKSKAEEKILCLRKRSIKSRTLILYDKFGGLGDNLFLSHIPRIAKESGKYDKVLISTKSMPRSKEIYHLVWEMNPFVDGMTDQDGISSGGIWLELLKKITNQEGNLLDAIMLSFGLDDHKRFHEPEIYYNPIFIESFVGKTIFDPNYYSNAGDSIFPCDLHRYFHNNNIEINYMMDLRSKYVALYKHQNRYATKSLEDFCNVLYSAKEIYCFATGTATLCAALGKRAKVLYGENMEKENRSIFFHSKINEYIKV